MNFSGIKDKVLGKLQRRHKEDKRRRNFTTALSVIAHGKST